MNVTPIARTPAMALSRHNLLALAFLSASTVAASGCAPEAEDTGDDSAAVTEVPASPVEKQDINNCWIYTGIGWAESLHAQATGEVLDLSENWLTYWRFFELIAHANVGDRIINPDTVYELGDMSRAGELMARYGVVEESAFVTVPIAEAVRVFNASLTDGALATRMARFDPVKVRAALDDAFGLSSETISAMNALFGADGEGAPTPDTAPASAARLKLSWASGFKVRLPNPDTHQPEQRTLADALGEGASGYGWTRALAPYFGDERAWLKRIQRALHDGYAVPLMWYVDKNSGVNDGTDFELSAKGVGDGFWHVSLLTDYSATDVPGFGELRAGRNETRPEALDAALDDKTIVTVLRVKNSWGPLGFTLDPLKKPGYSDLHRTYFTAGVPSLPFRIAQSVHLPAGY
jgi:hypothetical protein